MNDDRKPNPDPEPGLEEARIEADFDAEDEALWALLGVVEDVPTSRDFVRRTLSRIETRGPGAVRQAGPARRLFVLRWAAGAAAAAALVAGVVHFAGDEGATVTPDMSRAVARGEDISDVVDLLANLKDTDLLALEADDAEAVQDEYLGG